MLHEHLPSPQETLFVCFQIASLALGTFQRNPCLLASKHRNVPATYSTNTYFRPWKSSTFRCFPSTQLWPCYGQGACSWVPRRFSQCRPSRSCRPRSKCTADPSARHGPWRHWPQGSVGCHPHLDGMTWPEVDDNWISLEWEFPIGLGFHWNWKRKTLEDTLQSAHPQINFRFNGLAHSRTQGYMVVVHECWSIPPAAYGRRTARCVPCSSDSWGRRWVQVVSPSCRPRCWGDPRWYPGIHPYHPSRQWRRCASPERHTPRWWANVGPCILGLDSWPSGSSGQKNGNISARCQEHHCTFFPESVWAQGSSNSGGLYLIFSSSHLLIFTSSHLHICSSSHLLIFTSAHLHIFSSSHLLIFTSAHLHIFSSSHLLIFTSAHLHIFSSLHLLIFTSAHLHICSSSHTHIFSFSLSHSHLHILTSSLSLPLLFPLSFLSLSPFSFPFLFLAFFIFLSLGRGWCRRGVTKRQPFRTKWGSMRKNCGKIAILLVLEQPFRTKWWSIVKNCRKIANLLVPEQPFRTKWGSIVKNWRKIAILLVPEQPFRTKWGSIVKNCGKTAILLVLEQPFHTKWGSIVKNWRKIANLLVPEQPFRTKWGSMRKNCGKIAILLVLEQPFRTKWWSIVKNWGKIANLLVPDLSRSNPFARNEGRCAKTEIKLRFYLCRSNPFARNDARCAKTECKSVSVCV